MRLPLLSLLMCAAAWAQRAPGNDTISRDQLKADLHFLAGDSMRGRLTGTHEYALAGDWIASRLERLGLRAVGGGFFHSFDLILGRLSEGNRLSAVTGALRREGRLREDFYPHIFSATAEVEADVVFCGYGITAPKLGWQDFRDIRGKAVLILEGDPAPDDPRSRFDGVVQSDYGSSLRKTLAAQASGAAAVLITRGAVDTGRSRFRAQARSIWPDKPPHLERYTLAADAGRIHIPAIQISPEFAALLLESAGKKLEEVKAKAEEGSWGVPLALASRVRVRTAVERQVVEDRNVVAMVEGAGAEKKLEAVILSAHYDHNGATSEQIYNGADDNGSGVAALLEIAEAYATASQRGQRPQRTVVFAAWGSEERCCGPLLGAWAWTAHPAWPLERTVAVLNMDMIGRNEEVPEGGGPRFNGLKVQTAASNANHVNLIGYSHSPDLVAAVEHANRDFDLRLLKRYDNSRSNHLRRSDHWPFLQRGVPAVWFHTGLHPDYHTQYDRPEKIDYGKMERIARLVHQVSWELANAKDRPRMAEPRVIPIE